MKSGWSPTDAAEEVVQHIAQHYPSYTGGLIAVNATGHYGTKSDTEYLLLRLI